MKSLSERIEWLDSVEDRKWKRMVSCAEMLVIGLLGAVVMVVTVTRGDGTALQPSLLLFTALLVVVSSLLAPVFYTGMLRRWQMSAIALGLAGGTGASSVACLLMLRLQSIAA